MDMEALDCHAASLFPDAPDSVKTVLCTLEDKDPMTGADLRAATGLPRRTLYSALRTLQDRGVIRQQVSLRDSRQRYFWLDAAAAS